MRIKINLDTMRQAQELAQITSQLPGTITITDGAGLRVNAKSILGILYSIEFNEIWLESEHDIYRHIKDFVAGE